MTRSSFSVLAIDGGGIRGIIPARILQAIEDRTHRPVAELFDLVAGTSTGGILALGLTKPNDGGGPEFPARDLLELYTKHGEAIFDKSSWHAVASIGGLLHERYPVNPLEKLLRERFGDAMLASALVEVVIPAYDLTRPGPFFFKRVYARDEQHEWDVPFWQVARATSAAPTYFDPMPLPPFSDEPSDREHALVDGGVFANNPAACAYAEALEVFTSENPAASIELQVVSIGTGTPPPRPGAVGAAVTYDRARGWGLAEWAAPMLHVVFDGVAKTVDHQMKLLCGDMAGAGRRYHRIQHELAAASPAMDDASATNISGLIDDAERIVADRSTEIDEVCAVLATIAAERDADRTVQ